MTKISKERSNQDYHIKHQDLDAVLKAVKVHDIISLGQFDIVDVQIANAINYFSGLDACSFELTLLDRLISGGQNYSNTDIEFKIRHSLLTIASELNGSAVSQLMPLFKSFDLTNDDSHYIKNENVRRAIEAVFLEILIVKNMTYSQCKRNYLIDHPHHKFYPIELDEKNGVTIRGFWPAKPNPPLNKGASNKTNEEPWTLTRMAKLAFCVGSSALIWFGVVTDGWNEMGPAAIFMGVLWTAFIVGMVY